MSESVLVAGCCDEECVIVYLDLEDDSPVILYEAGPPGPPGNPVTKSGVVVGSDFDGAPQLFAVIFTAPYTNVNYAILLSGTDGRDYTYESKTRFGFTINANASTPIDGEVSWFTTPTGET